MSTSFDIIKSVIITFIATLTLNSTITYFSSDHGVLNISRPITINNTQSTIITIDNYSDNFINDIYIETTSDLDIKKISTDFPIEIAPTQQTNNTKKIIKISKINPKTTSRIVIPTTEENLRVVNSESAGVTIKHDEKLLSPVEKAIISTILIAAIYATIEGALTYINIRNRNKLIDKVDEFKKEHEEIKKQTEINSKLAEEKIAAIEKRMKKIDEIKLRQKLLLQARIHDYAKELEFWKNIIKSIVINNTDTTTVKNLFKAVTRELNTHGTNDKAMRHDETWIAAQWISEAEKKE